VLGRRVLLRAPYLVVGVAFALAIGATIPLAQSAVSSPAVIALALLGLVVAAAVVLLLVRALTLHARGLSAEITGVTGALQGERQTLNETKTEAAERLRGLQEQRRAVEDRLTALIRAFPGAVIWYDKGGNVVAADGAGLTGLFPGDKLVGRGVKELKERHPNAEWNLRRALAGEEFTAIEQLAELRIETRYLPLREGKSVSEVVAVSIDLRERDRLEQALRESDERARRMFEELPIAAAFVGVDDRILLANRAFSEAIGIDAKQLATLTLTALTHPDDAQGDKAVRERLLRGEVPVSRGAKRLVRRDGDVVAFDATETVIRDAHARPLYVVVMLKDATGRAHDEQVAAHYARHDPATDLPNRVAFDERLEQSLAKMSAEKQRLGLVAFDVVNLGAVAQRLGRGSSDAMLREMARRIAAVADAEALARTGRGQFALTVPRRGAAGTAEVVEKLLSAVADGFTVEGQRVHADLRLGFAMYPEDASDGEQLLRRAEAALHHAKKNDRRYVRYGDNVLV
jgi:diguanylate cyclase (GGDEF)-like protein/PAS domain S-box-containing protein